MSDAAEPIGPDASAAHRGEALVTLADVPLALAWNVRGDPSRSSFVEAAGRVLGIALPLQPNTSSRDADTALLWLGPTSWLFTAQAGIGEPDFDATRKALNAVGGALFDVSASYVAWSVSGVDAPQVLNRSCPLDLHPRAFTAGRCAQSLLGHINALLYRPDERPMFVVIVARSLAADAREALDAAMADRARMR